MSRRIPETRKKPGVFYAWSDQGLELPVVDVTHPEFRLDLEPLAWDAMARNSLRDQEKSNRLPPWLRRLFLAFFLRGSLLARGIAGSRGTYLGGMGTYLLKLGPNHLGSGYAKPVDRKIAASLPCVSLRLRLQDMAWLTAEALIPRLEAHPQAPLLLVNIAGGPASDSWNALLILNRDRPDLIRDRPIEVHIWDREAEGPAFGLRALAALQDANGPLEGRNITGAFHPYDWSRPSALDEFLRAVVEGGALVAGSSEGGLFEYGADEDILRHLRALGDRLSPGAVFMGTLSRKDGWAGDFNRSSGAALRLWDLPDFAALAASAGWTVLKTKECPLGTSLVLEKV